MSLLVRARRPPPPPHDPRERVLVAAFDGWEVRDFAAEDPRHAYFALRGFAHLQLWQPANGLSVLTRSRLTEWSYEAFPVAGWKHRDGDWRRLAARLLAEHGAVVPSATVVRALERWFPRHQEPAARA